MVYLDRIYTKSGDAGETGLGDGSRVPKDSARIAAIGDVDELNATLGLLLAQHQLFDETQLILDIQNHLFDVGADLCMPQEDNEITSQKLRILPRHVELLEHAIDRLNERLAPLRSFVLPGGHTSAAWCHLARTVCRRAERSVVTLMKLSIINPEIVKYLNRLSDLLFVLARCTNENGARDVLWVPGR